MYPCAQRVGLAVALATLGALCGFFVACVPATRTLRAELDGAALNHDFADLTRQLLLTRGRFEQFEAPGPVGYRVMRDRVLVLDRVEGTANRTVVYDAAVPNGSAAAPLAILVHGNHSRKEAHRYQAEHLASFGIFAVALEVPNEGRWLANGELVRRLVEHVVKSPTALGRRIDKRRIVLIGHSFGGSAVTLAAAGGAPVRGLVLLDPAVFSPEILSAMRRVRRPTLLLGADPAHFRARQRRQFFDRLRGGIVEISVVGATHDDAQSPSMYALTTFGIDPYTSPDRQRIFSASLTAGVISLAATGKLDFAEETLEDARRHGAIKDLRRRAVAQGGTP